MPVVYVHHARQGLRQNQEELAFSALQANFRFPEDFVATVLRGTAVLLVALSAPSVRLDRYPFLVDSALIAVEWDRHGHIFSSNVLFVL